MNTIGNNFNYNDVFIRSVTVGLLDTLESTVKWVNIFENNNKVEVNVPFYYAMLGDERYLLDAFVDDIVSDVRLNELNVDIIPRGHLTLASFNMKNEEATNPNIYIHVNEDMGDEMKTLAHKVRAMPMRLSYTLEILLESEIDIFKASQAVLNTLWTYDYFTVDFKGMSIDCVVELPDDHQFEIAREGYMTSDTKKKLTLPLEVHTNYPAYLQPKLNTNNESVLKRSKWYSNIRKSGNNQ